MERFDQIFTKVSDRLALYSSGIILLAIIFYVSANVFSRYVLRQGGIIGCYTYVGIMLLPLLGFGLSYAWSKRAYVVIELLEMRLKGKVNWGFQFTFLLITLVLFSGMLFVGTFTDCIVAYTTERVAGEPGHFSPLWPWKATLVIGFFLMAVRNLLDLITMVRTGKVISKDR